MRRNQVEILPNSDPQLLRLTGSTANWRLDTLPREVIAQGTRIVFFVHGFNNDKEDAELSYLKMKNSLALEGVRPGVLESIWEVFWPGYVASGTPGVKNRLSFMTYAGQVPKTEEIAPVFAEFLDQIVRENQAPLEVVFVAHSLGCRLVLETVKACERISSGLVVAGMCLMAAAVPTFLVEGATPALASAARLPASSMILYSPADRVLQFAFPAGQTAAANGWFPEAVGRFGNPSDFWRQGKGISVNTGLNHGEYFRGPFEPVVTRTGPYVAKLLQIPTANTLPVNHLARSPSPSVNRLPENRLKRGNLRT